MVFGTVPVFFRISYVNPLSSAIREMPSLLRGVLAISEIVPLADLYFDEVLVGIHKGISNVLLIAGPHKCFYIF